MKNFNYCFWAKLIVAIPALPLLGVLAASLVNHPYAKIAAAISAMALALALALWLDKKNCLKQKIRKTD